MCLLFRSCLAAKGSSQAAGHEKTVPGRVWGGLKIMGMRLLFYVECQEFLDMDGACPKCGFRPGGAKISGWDETGDSPEFIKKESKLPVGVLPALQASLAIRAALAGLDSAQIIDALYGAGYCPHCGSDKRRPDGTRAICHCRDDE